MDIAKCQTRMFGNYQIHEGAGQNDGDRVEEAERLGGLEVDHQLELGRLLDQAVRRQIRRAIDEPILCCEAPIRCRFET